VGDDPDGLTLPEAHTGGVGGGADTAVVAGCGWR
jgi:hypothetical protein